MTDREFAAVFVALCFVCMFWLVLNVDAISAYFTGRRKAKRCPNHPVGYECGACVTQRTDTAQPRT